MDQRLKGKDSTLDLGGILPPRNDSQFIAQLPEIAVSLLDLSTEFETSLMGLSRTLRIADTMRGWNVLECLARESLYERARLAAETRAEQERQQAKLAAQSARPSVPRRTIESAMKQQAIKALDDPGVLNALKQWTQARNTSKS